MTWRQGAQDFHKLEDLSNITVRLLRLTLFKKLEIGEQQLRMYGIDANLMEEYKKFIKEQTPLLDKIGKGKSDEPVLTRVHTPKESAF